METPKTIKVQPWGEGQGDHVVINEADFDSKFHKLLDEAGSAGGKASDGLGVAELRAALEAKGIEIPEGAKKADLKALLDAA